MYNIEHIRKIFENDRFATENGIEIMAVNENYAKCRMVLTEHHLNARGAVMGGAIYTLADFAFAVASNSGEQDTVTLNSSITFLSSTQGKVLFAETLCEKNGRSIVAYRINITDDLGELIAVVLATGKHVRPV